MDKEELEIWLKVKRLVKGGRFSESSARDFFAALTPNDYERIILLFEKGSIPDISPQTKDKLLTILKQLRDKGLARA